MSTITLSAEQQAVVNEALTGNSNIACIAAAGSGKTTMLTRLVEQLTKAGARPSEILVVTFNKDAAEEFCERLVGINANLFERCPLVKREEDKRAWRSPRKDVCRTFDSFLPQLDDREWMAPGKGGRKEKACLQYNKSLRNSLWKDALRLAGSTQVDWLADPEEEEGGQDPDDSDDSDSTSGDSMKRASALLRNIWCRICAETGVNPSDRKLACPAWINDARADWSVLQDVFRAFDDLCRLHSAWDFGHVYTSLLGKVKAGGEDLKSMRRDMGRYRFVIIDEAQDNSAAQNEIIQALCWPASPNGPRLLMVGDPRQCIYEWRGARPEQLVSFSRDASTRRFDLTLNRRSLQPVVSAADAVVRGLRLGPDSRSVRAIPETGCVVLDSKTRADAMRAILALYTKPGTMAVLSHTNKGVGEISSSLLYHNVPHKTSKRHATAMTNGALAAISLLRFARGDTLEARIDHARGQAIVVVEQGKDYATALLSLAKRDRMTADELMEWWSGYSSACENARTEALTIHAAKGREWDVVFIRNPLLRDQEDSTIRLMYVAITRARDHSITFDCPEDMPAAERMRKLREERQRRGMWTSANFLD